MKTSEFPWRQIHLDFHTSPHAPDVGADFDPDEFVRTLKDARVNSITCFSRCHHGMIYHETQFPAKHPNLKRNLLPEQIEACHRAGIRAPIYITVGLDMYQWEHDPGIAQISRDGKTIAGAGTLQPGWVILCFNSRYIDYVVEQTREVLQKFDTDGLFFDIIHHSCCCPRCVDLMRKEGIDPNDDRQWHRFNHETIRRFKERMNRVIRDLNKDCTIFYNSGHIDWMSRETRHLDTHLELESLPSGGWGYDHFPITGRYGRKADMPWMMMTGRFHTTWGDFGSYKNQAALDYECLRSVTLGGGCSVGDQLHPRGRLEPATYDLIGESYRQVEALEPLVRSMTPVAEMAILFSNSVKGLDDDYQKAVANRLQPSDRGAYRMLLEEHLFFDFLDPAMDLDPYKLIVLPDDTVLDDAYAAKLKAYLNAGGSIICSHRSGLHWQSGQFALPLPLKVVETNPPSPEFIHARGQLLAGVPDAPIVMYETGLAVAATGKVETLAEVHRPYFRREAGRFCSHQHWPAEGPAGRPAAVRAESIIYFSHPIFSAYGNYTVKHYRQMVANAINLLMPNRLLRSNLPSTAHVDLLQNDKSMLLSVMHYVPENRNAKVPTVEEPLPLIDANIELQTPSQVKDVAVLLDGKPEGLRWSAGPKSVRIDFSKMTGPLFLELKF